MTYLKEGEKAPAIQAEIGGKEFTLTSLKGKKIVLYFYPKDDTSGCTAEACNLKESYTDFQAKGFEVIGVSPDNAASHEKFTKKYELPFPLIADPELKIIKDYGVWGEKSMYGKKYMGLLRTTFIIDENGNIEKIIEKVKTKEHSKQIFKELKLN
jgi:peroxiredoxin Q/BCP